MIFEKFSLKVANDAREQTLRTISDLLLAQRGDYRDLFTTRKTFLTRSLGMVYRVPVTSRDGWESHEFAKDDPRAGLLTQIAFTALHSHPGRSSATLRGKAIRELLLCQKVPAPPNNVDFKLVQDTASTEYRTARDRLTAHSNNETCAGCHKIIDPLGLALENFDGIGGFRARENDAAIDPSGTLDGTAYGCSTACSTPTARRWRPPGGCRCGSAPGTGVAALPRRGGFLIGSAPTMTCRPS